MAPLFWGNCLKRTGDAVDGADLVLPLSGHDLGVGARDVDLGVQAGLVVGLDEISCENLAGTVSAVVRALGSGETVLGPAVRPALSIQQGVLLLETEPVPLAGELLHEGSSIVAVVVGVGLPVRHPGLAHDEDVVAEAERVRVDRDGAEVDIGVVARCLASGRPVEVPLWEVFDGRWDFLQSLYIWL